MVIQAGSVVKPVVILTLMKNKTGFKTQTLSNNCKTIHCPSYDTYKDFQMEPTGYYVLIKPNFEISTIEAAICNKEHVIVQIFQGQKSQDIYHAIFAFEKENNIEWLTNKEHIAYLGKELKKAELALVLGNNAYFQE